MGRYEANSQTCDVCGEMTDATPTYGDIVCSDCGGVNR